MNTLSKWGEHETCISVMVAMEMKHWNLVKAMEESRNTVEESPGSAAARLKSTAFVRNRKLTIKRVLHLILKRIYRALQLHLDDYFDDIGAESVTKQALSKSRKNLNPEYVRSFFDITAKIGAEDETLDSYKGMRLIAIDGSDIALENVPALKEKFGCSGPNKSAATALCSIAYGPLDHVVYDCRLDKYKTDERDLARLHVERLDELGLGGSLLLFDRWYPSAEFISFLCQRGYHFVMRVRSKWNLEADAIQTQGHVLLTHQNHEFSVRVLKVKLNTGETETLLTSLNQKQLPIRQAGALYFKRWAVETSFELLKIKLQLENFSGKTVTSIFQDFYATMYIANLAAFAAGCADQIIANADAGKDLRHPRQANRNRSIHKLRKIFLSCIMEPDASLREAMLYHLVSDIAKYPVSIVPGRSPVRKSPRSKHFHIAKKSVV